MKWDFRHHLLLQIEILGGGISHEEFSERLGGITERCLARYVAGKTHLQESEFRLIAKALSIDVQTLAQAWASSLGLRVSRADAESEMVERAYCQWSQHSRISGVPSSPSPMAVIRAKYADRLPRKTPPLWFGAHFHHRTRKAPQKTGLALRALTRCWSSLCMVACPRGILERAVSAASERDSSWLARPIHGPGANGSTSLTHLSPSKMRLNS
jgi:hypothetical protein